MNVPKPELRLTGDSEECPHCHANLVAGTIPEDQRENYGGKDKYIRVIAVIDPDYDCAAKWKCPDCGEEDHV